MKQRFIALFSGFPEHHFTKEIAERLQKELTDRKRIAFISAWPSDYRRNDEDSYGMHRMLADIGLRFDNITLVDYRTEPNKAKEIMNQATCIWLMGGNATMQMKLIKDLQLRDSICNFDGPILGVSAGSMNLAKTVVDVWESLVPYEGLGLTDITLKSHFTCEELEMKEKLIGISMDLPINVLEDLSAIFITDDKIEHCGKIYRVEKGNITPW